jgi:hypothetical protein
VDAVGQLGGWGVPGPGLLGVPWRRRPINTLRVDPPCTDTYMSDTYATCGDSEHRLCGQLPSCRASVRAEGGELWC